jgi:diaminopimelate decarboxylase
MQPAHPHLWPITADVDPSGRLTIAGLDLAELAREYGTPLYVFDEATIRERCQTYRAAFSAHYMPTTVAYAAKAYLSPTLCAILREEGLELDAVSAGEIAIAQAGGFPPSAIHLHGNFKPESELRAAVAAGVGRMVVDSLDELTILETIARDLGTRQAIWLRLCPDVATDTHPHDQTGHADSKFGLDVASGAADAAIQRAVASPHLDLTGIHAHAGSQLFDPAPAAAVTTFLVEIAARTRDREGITLRELSPGGGWGVAYHPGQEDPPVGGYANAVVSALRVGLDRYRLAPPGLFVEPGRGIIARAGVALYTAGPRKTVPGGRTFLAVDGGMGDNIRPALYGARYHAALPARVTAPPTGPVSIVGRYCESGDMLVETVAIPDTAWGDIVAVPVAGAYQLPMASNYNAVGRPAVAFVRDGSARLVRRREVAPDLLRMEIPDTTASPSD